MGKLMKWWKHWDNDFCPAHEMQEDATCVWTCSGQGADDKWSTALCSLEQRTSQVDTNSNLVLMVM